MCLICIKYRIIILIIIIKRLGEILLNYRILQTHHARTHALTGLGLGLGGVGTVASSRMLRIRCRAWLDLCRADNFLLVWGGFAGAPTKPSIADADILCEL